MNNTMLKAIAKKVGMFVGTGVFFGCLVDGCFSVAHKTFRVIKNKRNERDGWINARKTLPEKDGLYDVLVIDYNRDPLNYITISLPNIRFKRDQVHPGFVAYTEDGHYHSLFVDFWRERPKTNQEVDNDAHF